LIAAGVSAAAVDDDAPLKGVSGSASTFADGVFLGGFGVGFDGGGFGAGFGGFGGSGFLGGGAGFGALAAIAVSLRASEAATCFD
jgi:hypothetical protein